MNILRSLMGILILFHVAFTAKAGLILDLQGTPGSSELSFRIAGSLTSQTNVLLGISIDGFSPFVRSDFAFTPLSPSALLEITRGGNIVGTTNVTHIRSSSRGMGLVLEIGPDQFVQANDQFNFSGSGVFTLPGAQTFDDFILGTYTGTPEVGFLGDVTLNISQITAVPEPSSLWSLVAAVGAMCFFRNLLPHRAFAGGQQSLKRLDA